MPHRSGRRNLVGGDDLTPRQREILSLITRGYTNSQIAAHYGISLDGAKWHVSEIITKLGVISRDEAAEWWRAQTGLRPRLKRFALRVLATPLPRMAAVGAAGVAGLTGLIAVAVVIMTDGGREPPLEPHATMTPTSQPETPSSSGTPGAPTPPAGDGAPLASVPVPTSIAIARGEEVSMDVGVLFLDPSTGGGEYWPLPAGATPQHVSPSGRYIAYMWYQERAGRTDYFLLDTELQQVRDLGAIGIEVYPMLEFAPGEEHVLAATSESFVLLRLPAAQIVADIPREPPKAALRGAAAWAPGGERVAFADLDRVLVADVNGFVAELTLDANSLRWTHQGDRFAATGIDGTLVASSDGTLLARFDAGYRNVRWSPSGDYISVHAAQGHTEGGSMGYLRIFSADGAAELLRVHGTYTCLNDYWLPGEDAVAGEPGAKVLVPDGSIVGWPGDPRGTFGAHVGTGRSMWLVGDEWPAVYVTDGTARLAEVVTDGRRPLGSIVTADDFHDFTVDGRAILTVGVGGSDSPFCLYVAASEFGVETPPLPAPVPVPTPSNRPR